MPGEVRNKPEAGVKTVCISAHDADFACRRTDRASVFFGFFMGSVRERMVFYARIMIFKWIFQMSL